MLLCLASIAGGSWASSVAEILHSKVWTRLGKFHSHVPWPNLTLFPLNCRDHCVFPKTVGPQELVLKEGLKDALI